MKEQSKKQRITDACLDMQVELWLKISMLTRILSVGVGLSERVFTSVAVGCSHLYQTIPFTSVTRLQKSRTHL